MNEYLKQNKENKGNKDGHASQTSYCITFFDRMHRRFNPLVAQVGEASPLSTYVTGIDPWVYWAGARVKKDAEKTSSHKPIQHSFSIFNRRNPPIINPIPSHTHPYWHWSQLNTHHTIITIYLITKNLHHLKPLKLRYSHQGLGSLDWIDIRHFHNPHSNLSISTLLGCHV